jgi:outer membrane protein assembly factor BamB
MRKILSLVVLVVLLTSSFLSSSVLAGKTQIPSSEGADQYKEGFRYNIQGWIYLHIQGAPYERGYQHGYLLAAEIVDMLNRWSNIIHNFPLLSGISKRLSNDRFEKMSETWWNFCTTQCYRMYWEKFPEEYQQEIKGIADGVTAQGGKLHGRDVSYQDILALNEMYEFLSKLTNFQQGIHPLRTFLRQLQTVIPEVGEENESTLIETFLRQEPAHHCNGFIATGNATTHGQLVFSQTTICGGGMWWWVYYISLRWNVILDVQPSDGHRVMMPTSPGLIWSDEDYYQSDEGIVLLETTVPQGLFDNRGLPLSVRARTAMQYGDDINDVLYSLRYRNDGSMNAVWLIGDTKTGEIARLDLGYRHSAVWRTFDGFYWSANVPMDLKVRLERLNIKDLVVNLFLHTVLKIPGLGYYSIRYIPEGRDRKFEELGNKYYGSIDVEVVKQIMCTSPIRDWITDVKVTDSDLLEQNGLWAFFGNPHRPLFISNVDTQLVTTEEVPPCGWVRLFGVPSKEDFTFISQENEQGEENEALWEYDTKNNVNNFTSAGAVEKETIYETTSSGVLFALNANTGSLKWRVSVGENPTAPVIHEGLIFVGHTKGLSVFSKHGEKQWEVPTAGAILSSPVVIENDVLFGDSLGNLYSFAALDGQEHWRMKCSDEISLSSTYDENIYFSSGKSCYAASRETHTILWSFDSEGRITSAPLYAGDVVYVASWDNYVYALDAETGAVQWKYQAGWGFDVSPVVSNGVLFVGSVDNNLYALQADGTVRWVFTCKAGIHSSPIVYGDYVFFGSDDGRVYAVNQSTGEPVWFFAPGLTVDGVRNYATTPIVSDLVVSNRTVYFGANGTIYALEAQTSEKPAALEQKTTESFFSSIPTSWYLWILIIVVITLIILYVVLRKKK